MQDEEKEKRNERKEEWVQEEREEGRQVQQQNHLITFDKSGAARLA